MKKSALIILFALSIILMNSCAVQNRPNRISPSLENDVAEELPFQEITSECPSGLQTVAKRDSRAFVLVPSARGTFLVLNKYGNEIGITEKDEKTIK